MRIALVGYGKMGRMIENLAASRGHDVGLKIDYDNRSDLTTENLSGVDVAIEFTNPEAAFDNVKTCLEAGIPVVSGSTGWNHRLPEMKEFCKNVNGSFLHTSNFSVGVNIFFEINKLLARLMSVQPDYHVTLKEVHHTQKKDAPSGTAVTLADQIIGEHNAYTSWTNNTNTEPGKLSILSERIDPAPGTHHVKYESKIDDIEIIHTAHSREGFALGAIMAAEFIYNKKGIFSMKDVLAI